ncbi:MAG: hypothetical protein QXJ27_01440 [Thermoplasmata archaeon]
MERICVANNIVHIPHYYNKEDELEKDVLANAQYIFGEDILLLPKQKVRTEGGVESIPDALVLFVKDSKWAIVEIELASHDLYDHILAQVEKFSPSSKRDMLIEKFYELGKLSNSLQGMEDKHKFISDVLRKEPERIIIIDEISPKVEEFSSKYGWIVLEFKKYVNEKGERVFIFDTHHPFPQEVTDEKIMAATEKSRKRGSKFDVYWKEKVGEVIHLILQAYKEGISDVLDVSELGRVGKRQPGSWYATCEFWKNMKPEDIKESTYSHLRTLLKLLIDMKEDIPHEIPEHTRFRIKVWTDAKHNKILDPSKDKLFLQIKKLE